MNEMAKIIHTIEGTPHDLKTLFNDFINIFTKKEFWIKGTKFQIMEIGPIEKFSTIFQLMPGESGVIQMKISFLENPSSIDVYYELNIEFILPKGTLGKIARRMMEKQRGYVEEAMDHQMIPLIKHSIQESIRGLEEDKDLKETKAEGPQNPLQILKIQFAKGEISEEEYRRKKKILEE